MKKSLWASSLIVLCFAAALAMIPGCQEQNSAAGISAAQSDTQELAIDTTDIRKARLIAAENIELKKQLEQCKKEFEECKQQALKEKEAGDKFTEFLFTENVRLEEENKQLKEKLEQK